MTMDQFINFRAYFDRVQDDAAIARANNEKKIDDELIRKTEIILSSMKDRERAKKFGPEEIRDINNMYRTTALPVIREMIEQRF